MATYLTRLKPEAKGIYSAATAYEANSLVTSADGVRVYLSVKDAPAGTPLTDTNYFVIHTDLTATVQSVEATREGLLEFARGLTDAVEASGNPVQLELMGGIPFDSVETTLEPIQEGSGDPSPDNIRPISGWTEAKLARYGGNLLPAVAAQTVEKNGITFTSYGDGSYSMSGTATAQAYVDFPVENVTLPDVDIYVHIMNDTVNSNACIAFMNPNNLQINFYSTSSANRIGAVSNLPGSTIGYFRLWVASGQTVDMTLSPMLRLDGTETEYEAHSGDSFTAEFGDTIYGGTLNWTTGEMAVTHGQIASYAGESLPGKWLSDRDAYANGTTPTAGAQVVFKLATPTVIQLTAQEIRQLNGTNTLCGDGMIRVQGKSAADIEAVADKALAAANSAAAAAASAKEAQVSADEAATMLYAGAGAHNAIYRGKYLGAEVTDAQWAAIADGTFDNLYIGDYWTIGGINYRIAAFDYYHKTGDTSCTTHHVVIVPDTSMYSHVMNDTDTTTGAYVGSKMYTEGLDAAKTTINSAFGSGHILSHRQYLQNTTTNGYASDGSWYDSTVELMTEQNVYGCKIFGNCIHGTAFPNNHTVDKSQYPLFAHRPDMISNRTWFWLRDVASDVLFCFVGYTNNAGNSNASYSNGVRPAFSIC